MSDYTGFTDEELCNLAKEHNSEAMETLINRYRQLVLSFAHHYYLTGGDIEDIIQVGQIGVFNAITTYNGMVEFKYYVFKCVRNAVFSAVKKSNANKHSPLNNSLSLSGFQDKDEEKNPLFADLKFDPIERIVNAESEEELKEKIKNSLSKYENEILAFYLQGYSYVEISKKLNKTPKSIDNALQRIKKKVSLKINNVE
ncbi:MAG: sigma-70 family RNA polymerase sigma factor [Clostridia bacterium]|nr:sigma-70 family RNA polymerase sigma factor [Clostridia bacterium]